MYKVNKYRAAFLKYSYNVTNVLFHSVIFYEHVNFILNPFFCYDI